MLLKISILKFVFCFNFNIDIKFIKIKLKNQPNIKAYKSYLGIKKYIKQMFIIEDKMLFLNINICSPKPFNIPEKVTCKYKNGHKNPMYKSCQPISCWE